MSVSRRLDDGVSGVDCESYLSDTSVWTLNLKAINGHVRVPPYLKQVVEVCGDGVNGCGRHSCADFRTQYTWTLRALT